MPKEFPRSRRVAEQIQRELSHLIAVELQDPRLRLVTVTAVEVSSDLSHARIFVSVLGADDASEAVMALRHAARRLRRRLGEVMHMRKLPELRFVEDRVQVEGSRLSALINEAVAEDRRYHPEEPDSGPKDS